MWDGCLVQSMASGMAYHESMSRIFDWRFQTRNALIAKENAPWADVCILSRPLGWAHWKIHIDCAAVKLNVEAQIARVDCHTHKSLPTNNLPLLSHSLCLDAPPQDR